MKAETAASSSKTLNETVATLQLSESCCLRSFEQVLRRIDGAFCSSEDSSPSGQSFEERKRQFYQEYAQQSNERPTSQYISALQADESFLLAEEFEDYPELRFLDDEEEAEDLELDLLSESLSSAEPDLSFSLGADPCSDSVSNLRETDGAKIMAKRKQLTLMLQDSLQLLKRGKKVTSSGEYSGPQKGETKDSIHY